MCVKVFQDNIHERDLGTRQCKWLDYLQTHSDTPIISCKVDGDKFSRWEPYTNFILPVTLRRPLLNELVLDFDGKQRKRNYKKAAEIMEFLADTTWTHFLCDHHGRGPHIHIFNINYKKAKTIIKIHKTNTIEILCNKKLPRAIGGLYKDGIHYCSYFPSVEDINPITKPEDVRFPSLDLHVERTVLNPIWDDVKKRKAEKYENFETDFIVALNNLPPKYKHYEYGVHQGDRNNAFCKLTGVFEKCGLSRFEALGELKVFNSRCKPPMSKKEVEYKFNKLWKK